MYENYMYFRDRLKIKKRAKIRSKCFYTRMQGGSSNGIYEIATPLHPFILLSLSYPQQVVVLLNFCIVIYNLIDLCSRAWFSQSRDTAFEKCIISFIDRYNSSIENSICHHILLIIDILTFFIYF